MESYQWEFSAKFRSGAFGWKSDLPIKRIKEAISEIKKVAKKEPVLAAEGAISFLSKVSPALQHVDSSSGAVGSAVNWAIDQLVPVLTAPNISQEERQTWLAKLWKAFELDKIPYIERLGDVFGELCVTQELASDWANNLLEGLKKSWTEEQTGYNFFRGTFACFSCLVVAQRYQELLNLLDQSKSKWWLERRFGVKALLAMGRPEDALIYAEASRGNWSPGIVIAETCEEILISMGRSDEAYERYGLEANQKMTNLATFRAIAKKYPHKSSTEILERLIKSKPGEEGKWFATAKDLELFDLAIELVALNPADPRTLARAAKDFSSTKPDFAISAGMASLYWISKGYGYEIASEDVILPYLDIMRAVENSGFSKQKIHQEIKEAVFTNKPNGLMLENFLKPYWKD